MSPRTLSARERQRCDALTERPLRAFRNEISRMTDSDLEHLRARLDARLVGARFTLSDRGMARHLASQEIPLLERRLALVTAQLARPQERQLRLVEPAVRVDEVSVPAMLHGNLDEREAA